VRGVKYERRLRRGFVAWLVAAAGIRVFAAQPENCGNVTDASVRHAIDETIAWATRTQGEDGRWIYRYDAAHDRDLGIYEMVRHAGLIVTLNQAAAAGFERARVPAQRADAYARTQLVERDGWTALAGDSPSTPIDVGASALWLAALSFESPPDLDTMRALGRFLAVLPAPMQLGKVEFDDGTWRTAFGCDAAAATGPDISSYGSWPAAIAAGAVS